METYLFDLIHAFIKQNDHVDLFVYKKDRKLSPIEGLNVKSIYLGFIPRKYRRFLFQYWLKKQAISSRYGLSIDLMRTPHTDLMICGGTEKGFFKNLNRKTNFLDRLEIKREARSFQTARIIVAHSKTIQHEIISLYQIDEKKIHVIYPPIDTKKFHSELTRKKDFFIKQFNLSPKKIKLLFPSVGGKHKGSNLFLDVAKRLPKDKFEFMLAGYRPKKWIGQNNIKILGFVENIEELYTAVDFMLLPSFYDAFGLVVPESLQCQTPVIISKYVGAKDIISPKEGIILDEVTPDAIAKGILQAAETNFNIAPNFAQRKGLTIEAHIKKLKEISEKNR